MYGAGLECRFEFQGFESRSCGLGRRFQVVVLRGIPKDEVCAFGATSFMYSVELNRQAGGCHTAACYSSGKEVEVGPSYGS